MGADERPLKKQTTATTGGMLWCSKPHSTTLTDGFKPIELEPALSIAGLSPSRSRCDALRRASRLNYFFFFFADFLAAFFATFLPDFLAAFFAASSINFAIYFSPL